MLEERKEGGKVEIVEVIEVVLVVEVVEVVEVIKVVEVVDVDEVVEVVEVDAGVAASVVTSVVEETTVDVADSDVDAVDAASVVTSVVEDTTVDVAGFDVNDVDAAFVADVDPVCPADVDSAATVGTVWAVVPGSMVVPPASLICTLSAWISPTRAFNWLTFADIKLVCVVTTASAFSLAALLALLSSTRSVEEHRGDKVLPSRVARIATMLLALTGLYSGALESIAFPRSVMLDFMSLQLAGVG